MWTTRSQTRLGAGHVAPPEVFLIARREASLIFESKPKWYPTRSLCMYSSTCSDAGGPTSRHRGKGKMAGTAFRSRLHRCPRSFRLGTCKDCVCGRAGHLLLVHLSPGAWALPRRPSLGSSLRQKLRRTLHSNPSPAYRCASTAAPAVTSRDSGVGIHDLAPLARRLEDC